MECLADAVEKNLQERAGMYLERESSGLDFSSEGGSPCGALPPPPSNLPILCCTTISLRLILPESPETHVFIIKQQQPGCSANLFPRANRMLSDIPKTKSNSPQSKSHGKNNRFLKEKPPF